MSPAPRLHRRLVAPVAALALVLVGAVAAPAQAATVAVKGTVACRNGQPVTGIWVNSSAGGSKFASGFTRRPGAAWIADYSTSLATSSTTTTLRVDVGCGGSASSWASNNSTPNITVYGSKTLDAICDNPATGGRAVRCKWWPAAVLIGMPFAGYFDKYGWAPPGGANFHHRFEADWATDIYAGSGTAAYARAFGPKSANIQMRVASRWNSCSGRAGVGMRISVTRNGTNLGWFELTHLDAVPSRLTVGATVSPNEFVGRTKQWPYRSGCWEVTNNAGVHLHTGAYNQSGYSCFAPVASKSYLAAGRWYGSIGATGATGPGARCA